MRLDDFNTSIIWFQVAAFFTEAPKAFHREVGEFVAAPVEGHLSRTSVVVALARLEKSGSSSSVSIRAAFPHVDPACGSAYVTLRSIDL